MMNRVECCENRLKAMVVFDKQEVPQRINKVIKSEVLFLLKDYFDITSEYVNIDINVNEYGKYELSITAESRSIRSVHVLGD